MNKMKKLLSSLLVVCMIVAMSVSAFAADDYTIAILNGSEGYTYVAYQIFAGTLSTDKTTLSDITWGSDVDTSAEGFEEALTKAYGSTDAATIATLITDAEDAAAFAEIIANYVSGGVTFSYSATGVGGHNGFKYYATVNAVGYYLIVNTGVLDGEAHSNYILCIVSDYLREDAYVSIVLKGTETPNFDKVVGTNDDDDTYDDDDATEDYAIGDSVPFTLTANLPANYSTYTTYKMVFTDTLSDGLTYDENSLKVTVGSSELSSDNYSLVVDGQTITVTIDDMKSVASSASDVIVVSYTATLNENATSIESNTASLTFSNNPYDSSSTTSNRTDKTYVVTFDVTVNKVDENNTALAGAEFTLYKYNSETQTYEEAGTVLTATNNAGTSFSVNGLAIGTYKLVETKTPDGYNTADDIEFTITAEAVESSTGVTVTSSVNNPNLTINSTTITTTVVNEAGSPLPSTGGIGTTIFYVVGGVLVLGAAVLLITRKRMGKAE